MKQAVAYILDASSSMLEPYKSGDTKSADGDEVISKFRAAQTVVQTMLSDLILQSAANEATVIILQTAATQHHMVASGEDEDEEEDIPARNITELGPGIVKPPVRWLRELEHLQPLPDIAGLQGDFCSGLMVAADALHRKTNNKKYERKIVLVTDAKHDVVVDVTETAWVVHALHELDCSLHVLGLDFFNTDNTNTTTTASSSTAAVRKVLFERPEAPTSTARLEKELSSPAQLTVKSEEEDVKIKKEDSETDDDDDDQQAAQIKKKIKADPDATDSDDDDAGTGSNAVKMEDSANAVTYSTQLQREQLLAHVTQQTGGTVTAVHTLQDLLDTTKGRKLSSPVKSKIELRIAPDTTIPCRRMLILSKATALGIKQGCVVTPATNDDDDDETVDGDDKPIDDPLPVFGKVDKQVLYIDPEKPDDTYEADETCKAVRFGSNLIPMDDAELAGNTSKPVDLPYIEIIGYVSRDSISSTHLIGPPYALTGADSVRSCAAISALAKALQKTNKVALCTNLKTKKGVVIIGALFPLVVEEDATTNSAADTKKPSPTRLVFLQLPFKDETKTLPLADDLEQVMAQDDDETRESKESICDRLVDAMMLPPDRLRSGRVRSAFWRSWNLTKVAKVIHPKTAKPVTVRTFDDRDPMSTPTSIVEKAKPICNEFYDAFPLEIVQKTGAAKKTKGGRRALYYADFLE